MTSTAPIASVIVPAHDEADTIAQTLRALLADASAHEFEVHVVCNGCTDDTAEVARSFAGVSVAEIDTPSKLAALREGDRRASRFPRIYLDADVPLPTSAARALTTALADDRFLVAGVRGRMDLAAAPPLVRLFYEFRERLPVFASGGIGAGVYALSEQGRRRFDEWPDLRSGDDQFVFRSFTDAERATVRGHETVIDPPPDLRAVVRRGVRTRLGNARLSAGAAGEPLPAPPAGFRSALRDALRTPRGAASAVVFVAVTMAIRLRARFGRGRVDWLSYQPDRPSLAEETPDTRH